MDRDEIIEIYSEYSAQFDERIGSLDIYNQTYVDFICVAKKKQSLLDLACGPGNVSAFIQKVLPDVEMSCVDLSDEMLVLAGDKLQKASFFKSDIMALELPERKYDMIVCAFGLPYIKACDIDRFVYQVDRFSSIGTSVYISCMEGNTLTKEVMSFADLKSLDVQRHRKEDVVASFAKRNFSLTSFSKQDYKEADGSVTADIILFFEKR